MAYKRGMSSDDLPPPRFDIFGDANVASAFLTWKRGRSARLLEPGRLAQAAWAFPAAGFSVGIFGAVPYFVGSWVGLPAIACALFSLATMAVLTGGLHADGLADTADGLGGRDRSQRLEIMRDSRIGAYGVMALVFVIGIDAAALVAIDGVHPSGFAVFGVLAAVASASRAAMVLVMKLLPPARSDGLGAWAGRPTWTRVALAGLVTWIVMLYPLVLYAWWVMVLMVAAGLAATIAVMAIAKRAFGGYTGDVLGAVQHVSEMAMLLAAAAALTHYTAS